MKLYSAYITKYIKIKCKLQWIKEVDYSYMEFLLLYWIGKFCLINLPDRVWWLVGLLLVAGFLPVSVDYWDFAILPHVQIQIPNNFTLLRQQRRHDRMFCTDTEKSENFGVDWRQLKTRTRISSLLGVIYDCCQYIFLHFYTHIWRELQYVFLQQLKKTQPDEIRWNLLCLQSSCVVYPIPAVAVLTVRKTSLLTYAY